MISKVEYQDLPNCVQITNGDATLIISTDVGPRILYYGFDGGDNILGWHPAAAVETDLGTWKPYGGHRLWAAPEDMPLSYEPDNKPIGYEQNGELSATFRSLAGRGYPVDKEIAVSLAETGTKATLDHRLSNRGADAIKIAAWALTIMRPGGVVVVPNEPYEPYSPDNLLPVRSMALWPYTDFTDRRWSFEKKSIRLAVDEGAGGPQKVGILNKQGWAAYEWKDLRFVKHTEYVTGAEYPDMNCNFEFYTDGGFVEIETLSPLATIASEKSINHSESWVLEVADHVSEVEN
jgi:hypothetical protein